MTVKDISLIVLWFVIFGVSTAVSYKVYVLDRDYAFVTLIPCDPETETCFVASCDPESETYLEDICLTIEEGQTERYFSYIKKKMKNVEACDTRDGECAPLVCEENEEGCAVITCTERTLVDYGDGSMGCTPEVIVPVAPDQTVELIEMSKEEAPAEEVIPVTQPAVEGDAGVLTPDEPAQPAPVEEDLPEPTHNLPI